MCGIPCYWEIRLHEHHRIAIIPATSRTQLCGHVRVNKPISAGTVVAERHSVQKG